MSIFGSLTASLRMRFVIREEPGSVTIISGPPRSGKSHALLGEADGLIRALPNPYTTALVASSPYSRRLLGAALSRKSGRRRADRYRVVDALALVDTSHRSLPAATRYRTELAILSLQRGGHALRTGCPYSQLLRLPAVDTSVELYSLALEGVGLLDVPFALTFSLPLDTPDKPPLQHFLIDDLHDHSTWLPLILIEEVLQGCNAVITLDPFEMDIGRLVDRLRESEVRQIEVLDRTPRPARRPEPDERNFGSLRSVVDWVISKIVDTKLPVCIVAEYAVHERHIEAALCMAGITYHRTGPSRLFATFESLALLSVVAWRQDDNEDSAEFLFDSLGGDLREWRRLAEDNRLPYRLSRALATRLTVPGDSASAVAFNSLVAMRGEFERPYFPWEFLLAASSWLEAGIDRYDRKQADLLIRYSQQYSLTLDEFRERVHIASTGTNDPVVTICHPSEFDISHCPSIIYCGDIDESTPSGGLLRQVRLRASGHVTVCRSPVERDYAQLTQKAG